MIQNLFFKDSKHLLSLYFLKRIRKYWKRKNPVGKNYPYHVHDPFELMGEDSGYEEFYLVGDSWLENPESPIIVAIGFNNWKFGFVADYLPEYRVAFAPRKLANIKLARKIENLVMKPSTVVIWGYNESKWLRKYLEYKKISIYRAEDGFLRSSELGANHSTPYSLVFDKKGLYYNTDGSSELDEILNNFDFSQELLDSGKELYDFFIRSKVSKYNPSLTKKDTIIKTKKRILVLGQVDNDVSLRFCNIDNWSMEDMVRLAKKENPLAEVVYRPHPEVYKGYQSSKFNKANVEFFASIQNPEVNIIESIEKSDHIYTICSLSGLEALIRGKKVTLLGRAFYGGWGLTDDRATYVNRNRKLNTLELFLLIYVVYPKYLCDLDNSYQGAISTIYRINSDKYIRTIDEVKTSISNKESISTSNFEPYVWPALLQKAYENKDSEQFLLILEGIELRKYFSDTEMSQKIFSYFLLGKCFDEKTRNHVLVIFRSYISEKVYNEVLLELHNLGFSDSLDNHWLWLLGENNEKESIVQISNIKNAKINEIKKVYHQETQETQEVLPQLINSELQEVSESLFIQMSIDLNYKRFESALDSVFKLLIIGYPTAKLFRNLCKILNLLALSKELSIVAEIYKGLDIYNSNRSPIVYQMLAKRFEAFKNDDEVIRFLVDLISLKPNLINNAKVILSENIEKKNKIDLYENIIINQLNFDNEIEDRKIQAYIDAGLFRKAELTAFRFLTTKKTMKAQYRYSQALSFNRKVDEAIALMKNSFDNEFSLTNVQELLRLYILSSEYSNALKLMKKAEDKGLIIGDMFLRKIYFGNRMVGDAFHAFTKMKVIDNLKGYYTDKYIDIENLKIDRFNSIFLIAVFGPGDEIRFASIYNQIKDFLVDKDVYISCSPNLENLFSKSFPEIQFIKVPRLRGNERIDLNNYSNVPGSDIFNFIDNRAVEIIDKVEKIALVTDFLHLALPDYESFEGSKYLEYDQALKDGFVDKIPEAKKIVGLSWRSSLSTTARNEHYLSVEELEPLFSIENVQFVNLQYDECDDELEWINSRYPGKILDFEDLDQYNDFDNVAALMSCMDLIIAPATTVVELAGALGVNTWLFSNSSEIDWRKTNSIGTDVWHSSITIVDVPEKGNKKALAEEIYRRLVGFVEA